MLSVYIPAGARDVSAMRPVAVLVDERMSLPLGLQPFGPRKGRLCD